MALRSNDGIDLSIKPYPALFIKGENLECIRKGQSLYPIRCGNVHHRLEHEDHCFYHDEVQTPLMEGMVIKRCVNYEKGCDFYVPIKHPNNGFFAFNNHLQSFVYRPIFNDDVTNFGLHAEDCSDERDLADYLIDIIPLLTKYLDSADLNCLSATNRSLNYHLSSYFKNERIVHLVDRKWIKKGERKWEPGPFERKFSKVQKRFGFCSDPKIIGPLIDHSQKCLFNVPVIYGNQRVSTLISELHDNSNN
uniref:F-box domain-containing protein n=1 Tax=Strongyloides venezuelensis TaxID=75913 RepID=A0A0K0FN38_STRVS